MLHQAGQARPRHINRRARTVGLGTILFWTAAITVGIHVAVLSVLAIAVHGEKVAPSLGGSNVTRETYEKIQATNTPSRENREARLDP